MYDIKKNNFLRFFYICYLLQFGIQEGFEIGFLFVNDIYNEFWEYEKWINDDGNQENYYYLDLIFVKEKVDFLQYDYVINKSGFYEFVILFG